MTFVLVQIPAVLIVGLLLVVVWISTRAGGNPTASGTWSNFSGLVNDPLFPAAVWNTVLFTIVTVAVAAFFALTLAWIVERTDFGHRRLLYTFMVVKILLPGFLTAMGWIFMFHPRIGAMNELLQGLFGLENAPVNITSVTGMAFVQGIGLSSIMFIMTSATIRTMDPSLEESAHTSGANYATTLRRVTAPLLYPSLLAAVLYTAAIAIGVFDIPAIMGFANRTLTLSTYLYLRTSPLDGLPQYGISAAASIVLMIIAIAAGYWYVRTLRRSRNYEVVSGKGYQPRLMKLGRWRWLAWLYVSAFFLLALILPLLMLLFVSLQPYVRAPTIATITESSFISYRNLPWGTVWESALNTLLLTATVPGLSLLMGFLFTWTVLRSRNRFRLVYDYIAFVPHAVPSVVFALGALVIALYWTRGWYSLYGSIWLIIVVMALIHVAFASRMINSALIQIHPDLEAAARLSGAGPSQVLRRVTLPLLRHSLAFAWLWMAILTFKELTVPVFLASAGNTPLASVVWSLWNAGESSAASAISLMMLLATVPLAVGYLSLAGVDKQ